MRILIRPSQWGGLWAAMVVFTAGIIPAWGAESHPDLRVLFLGDNGHHRPADRFKQLQPVLRDRGIELVYTENLEDLTLSKLEGFDCIAIYANHTKISPEQEKALLDFVAKGGGFVPIHCASYCFLNSPKYIELVGAQFKSHGTGVFRETIIKPDHSIMKGLSPIESWDESYVHQMHNPDRIVLAERVEGDHHEPYTWVREHGKGRVFYTAWGHDQRTWSNPSFVGLIENGIRWASAGSPTQLHRKEGLKPFEYVEAPAPLPNYVPGAKWGTQGDEIKTMQKPLSPQESMPHIVTFPEFRVQLVASEPDIAKPIWMTWDERGRLWVAETVDYPNNMQPPGQGHDHIKICEDTDGDGKADKFTIFVDQLSVPTSFVFANGGIIVVHSGKTEFFKDTDGDDKADVRQVLFTGWGTGDTHAGPSNLRRGFDNWIWGTVGYSGFRGTVGGKEVRFGQGIYRFKTDGSELEFIRSSNNNTWGLGLSEEGIIFGSTANGNASMYMPIPNRYYEAVNGWSASRLETIADSQRYYPITEKVRQVDWHGGYTAGAGSALYTARNFPKEYWNRMQFVAEPTGHLLGKFHLESHGADFVAHNGRNFLASDDEWTSPICAEVGPDGALWMIDWYSYVIQHNPTPRGFKTGKGGAYETPLRDQTHGRIYRIVYNEAKPVQPLRLDKATPAQWVEALKNDNMLWRLHAQWLLVEHKQKEAAPALIALTRDQTVDDLGLNPAAIHALWTLEGLGLLDGSNAEATEAAKVALKHHSAAVRRTAVAVLPRNADSLGTVLSAKLLEDTDPQVRLAALLAVADMPASDQAGAPLYAMLQETRNSGDRWIPDAATAAAARNDVSFLKATLASFHPAAVSADNKAPSNLMPNSSFENERDGKPLEWNPVTHSGRGTFAFAEVGHTGKRSVQISSEQGADVSWSAHAPVKPHTDYLLSGWIKTEGVSGALGALLNIHEMQDPKAGATKPLKGDNDWTRVELSFNSGDLESLTVNCLLGGWGRSKGKAWFDDITLVPDASSALAGEVGRVVRLVTAHYAQRGPVDSIVPTLLALKNASPDLAVPILDGLVSGWPKEKAPEISESDKTVLNSLMQSLPESARDRLLALAQRWGKPEVFGASVVAITDSLKKQVADTGADTARRVAAAKRLIGLDDSENVIDGVLNEVTLLTPPDLAAGLVTSFTEGRSTQIGRALVIRWPKLGPAARRAAISVFLRRPEWAGALLTAIEKGSIQRTDLATEHWSQLKLNPNRDIGRRAAQLAAAGSKISEDREEIVKKLLPLAKENGDPAHGKDIFTANCAVCHTFNGQGGKVGPDLSGIGARDRTEILLDILDPNRSVEANYRLWNVSTKDGETYSGRLDTETQTSIEILDPAGQKHVVQRKDIASLDESKLSVMPVGFDAIAPDDLKALLAYLTQAH